MLRGALIGCGFFAQNHLHAWRDVEGARIVCLCDQDADRLRQTGETFGIQRLYADAAAMLAEGGLDFVDVVTTVDSHRQLIELIAKHGLPVICQKPFANDLKDGRAMVEACAKAGVPLMVHENFRWQTPVMAVRAAIDSRAIGRPFFGRVSFRSAYDVFADQPYLATDKRFIIHDLGIHLLDVARFLFGNVETLSCRAARVNPKIVAEDTATVLMGHCNGVTSIVDCSYATQLPKEPFPETLIEIDGEEGTLRLEQGYRLTVHNHGGTRTIDVSPPLLSWARRPWHNIQESVFNIQTHWVTCIEKGCDPDTTGADNLNTLALAYAAYESAGTGQATIRMMS